MSKSRDNNTCFIIQVCRDYNDFYKFAPGVAIVPQLDFLQEEISYKKLDMDLNTLMMGNNQFYLCYTFPFNFTLHNIFSLCKLVFIMVSKYILNEDKIKILI